MNAPLRVNVKTADNTGDLDARLLALVAALDSLPDVRAMAVAPPTADLDALLGQLQRLTALLQLREQAPDWDAADQIAVRVMLQTVAQVAIHLRRALAAADQQLQRGYEPIRHAERIVAACRLELGRDHSDVVAESIRSTKRSTKKRRARDASPATATPRD